MLRKSKLAGFTLIELMVVILIVGVLAAASVPMMRGKIDRSKWTEANAAAGAIRTAMKVYFVETGSTVTGNLSNESVQQALRFQDADLNGAYFVSSDYEIDSVSADGIAVVTVTGSRDNAPSGSKTLKLNGVFE
jgi:prepilin-type N-terminal cleavage/methylation domain-containing protein